MKQNFLGSRYAFALSLSLGTLAACGGSQPPPAAPPSAPSAAPAPAPPPAASATPPAPATAEAPLAPPPAPPRRPHPHGVAEMFIAAVDSLELKPEQKTAVESIDADLKKAHDAPKAAHEKLLNDAVDGVAAGKLDKKKLDADINALGAAVAATTPAVQDAMNRLYKTLDAEQRKKLVATLRERGEHLHGMMGEGHGPGMMGEGHGPGMMGRKGGGPGDGPMGPGMMGPKGSGPGAGPMAPGKPGRGMGPNPGMMGPGAGPGMGPHGGMGHEHLGGPPMKRLVDELGLTPEQQDKLQKQLEAQMKTQQASMKSKHEAAFKHLKAIADAFEGDKFDAKKAGVGTQAPEAVKDMAKNRIAFLQTILGVLTPEQRTKFADHIRAHAAEGDEGPAEDGDGKADEAEEAK